MNEPNEVSTATQDGGADHVGTCAFMVNERQDEVCNKPGVEEVLVRNPFGLYAVWLCRHHKDMHEDFYIEYNRKRRQQLTTSRRRVTQGSRV